REKSTCSRPSTSTHAPAAQNKPGDQRVRAQRSVVLALPVTTRATMASDIHSTLHPARNNACSVFRIRHFNVCTRAFLVGPAVHAKVDPVLLEPAIDLRARSTGQARDLAHLALAAL